MTISVHDVAVAVDIFSKEHKELLDLLKLPPEIHWMCVCDLDQAKAGKIHILDYPKKNARSGNND